jgi:hypothetical protein
LIRGRATSDTRAVPIWGIIRAGWLEAHPKLQFGDLLRALPGSAVHSLSDPFMAPPVSAGFWQYEPEQAQAEFASGIRDGRRKEFAASVRKLEEFPAPQTRWQFRNVRPENTGCFS